MWPPVGDITEEEYLVREPEAEYNSEFRQGRVVAMAGASPAHARISANLAGLLFAALRGGPCHVFTGEVRIKVAAARFYTYPDAAAVCEEPCFEQPKIASLLNPTVIFEVLSPSSEAYDRGEKFGYYRQLPSLREYVLVSQVEMRVDQFTRAAADEWPVQVWRRPEERLNLPSLGVELTLGDIFERVRFG
jgi:Uma2 family endonuclease